MSPCRYNELMTGKRARVIIAILWILSFVIGFIPFLEWNKKKDSCDSPPPGNHSGAGASSPDGGGGGSLLSSCKLACLFESVVDMYYMVYFNFFVCVLLPLLIMLGIYLKIFTVARKQMRKIELKCVGNGDSHQHHRTLLQREIRAAKSLSIIMGLFAVCWLPVHVLNCITLFFPELHRPPILMYVAILLSHANSAVNPVIYAYRIQDFRNTFRKILSRHILCLREDLYRSSNGNHRHRDQVQSGSGAPGVEGGQRDDSIVC